MQALSKQGDKIVLDQTKCISCFCCSECCPNEALVPRIHLRSVRDKYFLVSLVVTIILIILVLVYYLRLRIWR
jgi:Fe-S-cluster-containing hydrogenase component 2